MASTLPLPQTNAAVGSVIGHVDLPGFEDLEQRDLVVPRWRLVQGSARDLELKKHAGSWVRNLDGEIRETLQVVILKVSPNRLLWSGDPSDTRPECMSRDCRVGTVYGACSSCDFNPDFNRVLIDQMEEARVKRKPDLRPKVCQRVYNLVVVDTNDDSLALLGAHGTSMRPMKVLFSQFVNKKKPSYAAVAEFAAKGETNEFGSYYVVAPRILRWLSSEEMADYVERQQMLSSVNVVDVEVVAEEDAVPRDEEDLPF